MVHKIFKVSTTTRSFNGGTLMSLNFTKVKPYRKHNGEISYWTFSFGAGLETLAVFESIAKLSPRFAHAIFLKA